MPKLGRYLREARNREGLTQEDLADRVGASPTTVSNWERDVTMPGIEDVNPLVVTLRLSPEVMLQKMGVLLTPPAAARLPRELVLSLLELRPEELATIQKLARQWPGLRDD